MIKETNPIRDDKGGNLISGKPLSPKHGLASPYPMILSWNIFLDICALSFEVAMKFPSSAAGLLQSVSVLVWVSGKHGWLCVMNLLQWASD
jgi:hypothetical protein